MRCKKGDLAVIVSALGSELEKNIGGMVRVEHRAPHKPAGPAWVVTALQELKTSDGSTVPAGHYPCRCEDACLWPIRPAPPPEEIPAPPVEIEKETT